MAEFSTAIVLILKNEGGYVDHPKDPGGATNFGISLRFLKSLTVDDRRRFGFFGEVTAQDVKDMTEDQAVAIYFDQFWLKCGLQRIADQAIANYLFDMCVNHGQSTAVTILQRALWAAYRKKDIVKVDGIMGEKTFGAISPVAPYLLSCMMAERAAFYRSLNKPEFLEGWLTRAYHY